MKTHAVTADFATEEGLAGLCAGVNREFDMPGANLGVGSMNGDLDMQSPDGTSAMTCVVNQ